MMIKDCGDCGNCAECGGKIGRLKVERDEEGWIWCRDCGLVENDGGRKKLEELEINAWFELVKKIRPGIKIRELRKIEIVDRFQFLKKLRL